jgi:hypothetical protein
MVKSTGEKLLHHRPELGHREGLAEQVLRSALKELAPRTCAVAAIHQTFTLRTSSRNRSLVKSAKL